MNRYTSSVEMAIGSAFFGPAQKRRRWSAAGNLILVLITDYAVIFSALGGSAYFRFGDINHKMVAGILAFLCVIYLMTAIYNGALSPTALENRRTLIARGVRSMALSILLLVLALFCFKLGIEFSRLFISYVFATAIGGIAISRYLVGGIVARNHANNAPLALAIFDDEIALPVKQTPGTTALRSAEIGLIPDPSNHANVDRLVDLCQHYERVTVHCSAENRQAWADMLRCVDVHCEVRLPELDAIQPVGLTKWSGGICAVVSERPLEWHQAMTKRILDLLVTVALLPALLPVMAVVAIAIKLESPGPIFFRQERIGLGNRSFMMLKFRSMRHDLADYFASTLTKRGDVRVTKVGAFIRRTSLDELPQFFNVLLGDMSIVGPRPHAHSAKAGELLYWQVDHKYWHRHIAKPGITGLAQIRGFRGNTFEESDLQNRLDADLEYVANWSLLRDIEIIFSTLRVVRHDRAF